MVIEKRELSVALIVLVGGFSLMSCGDPEKPCDACSRQQMCLLTYPTGEPDWLDRFDSENDPYAECRTLPAPCLGEPSKGCGDHECGSVIRGTCYSGYSECTMRNGRIVAKCYD
jgi:hypothetical protein